MKAKDYTSITEILEKKYQCKFYLFMDFKDVSDRIKQKVKNNDNFRQDKERMESFRATI